MFYKTFQHNVTEKLKSEVIRMQPVLQSFVILTVKFSKGRLFAVPEVFPLCHPYAFRKLWEDIVSFYKVAEYDMSCVTCGETLVSRLCPDLNNRKLWYIARLWLICIVRLYSWCSAYGSESALCQHPGTLSQHESRRAQVNKTATHYNKWWVAKKAVRHKHPLISMATHQWPPTAIH